MDGLDIRSGLQVADIGAGEGYYTVRLARRLGPTASIYAEDVVPQYLKRLKTRLERDIVTGVRLTLGAPRDPKLPPSSIDVAILSHVYHEIGNPFEFFHRLRAALRPNVGIGTIDLDRPTQNHGTPPTLLQCELAAVGYRQIDFVPLTPAEGYLAVFLPPDELPAVGSIKPCKQPSGRQPVCAGCGLRQIEPERASDTVISEIDSPARSAEYVRTISGKSRQNGNLLSRSAGGVNPRG